MFHQFIVFLLTHGHENKQNIYPVLFIAEQNSMHKQLEINNSS